MVGCYPRRWQQRHRQEVLDVLDQHRATPRTVLSLAGGALAAHADPDCRMERPVIRVRSDVLKGIAQIVGVAAGGLGLLAVVFVLSHLSGIISDMSWHLGRPQGTNDFSFTPDQRLMISAGGDPSSGNVTLWAVTRPAGLRRLSFFEGGGPAASSPDGRTVATVAFGGRPAVFERVTGYRTLRKVPFEWHSRFWRGWLSRDFPRRWEQRSVSRAGKRYR
jgi:hypothetical protein